MLKCYLLNAEQLELEGQVRVWRDIGWASGRAVGKVARNDEPALATDLHRGQTFLPAFDQPGHIELRRLSTARALKFFSIFQPAGVMNNHRLIRSGTLSGSDREILHLQSGGSRDFRSGLRAAPRHDVSDGTSRNDDYKDHCAQAEITIAGSLGRANGARCL